jgi:hypothetical protein
VAVVVLLADHNIEGQARMLLGMLQKLGWSDLLDLRLGTFTEVGLTDDSSDRVVWRRAQELGMILLTDNRNNEGPDSLEQTLLDEVTPTSLPILTVGSAERLRSEQAYRVACAERVAEIVFDLDRYRGVPRLYFP